MKIGARVSRVTKLQSCVIKRIKYTRVRMIQAQIPISHVERFSRAQARMCTCSFNAWYPRARRIFFKEAHAS